MSFLQGDMTVIMETPSPSPSPSRSPSPSPLPSPSSSKALNLEAPVEVEVDGDGDGFESGVRDLNSNRDMDRDGDLKLKSKSKSTKNGNEIENEEDENKASDSNSDSDKDSTADQDPDEDDTAWQIFLSAYARGDHLNGQYVRVPPPLYLSPSLSPSLSTSPSASRLALKSTSTSTSESTSKPSLAHNRNTHHTDLDLDGVGVGVGGSTTNTRNRTTAVSISKGTSRPFDSTSTSTSSLTSHSTSTSIPNQPTHNPTPTPQSEFHTELSSSLYSASSTSIPLRTARLVRQFYTTHGYLPPPRSPEEGVRVQCIKDYDLGRRAQMRNIQKATELLAGCFSPTSTSGSDNEKGSGAGAGGVVCTFSLFKDDAQHHVAAAGPPSLVDSLALSIGTRVPPQISLCGHTILSPKSEGGLVYVRDLGADWRFSGNPWVRGKGKGKKGNKEEGEGDKGNKEEGDGDKEELGGMKSYIGSVVRLRPDPTLPLSSSSSSSVIDADRNNADRNKEDDTVAIGALNICFLTEPLLTLSSDQIDIIRRITDILEGQLALTWQAQRHEKEVRARQAVSDFLEEGLVRGMRPQRERGSERERGERVDGTVDPTTTTTTSDAGDEGGVATDRNGNDDGDKYVHFRAQARYAVEKIREQVREIGFVCILDTSSFVSSQSRQKTQQADDDKTMMGVLASSSDESSAAAAISSMDPTVAQTVSDFLDRHVDHHHRADQTIFVKDIGEASGLEPLLPSDTYSHLILPLFSGGDALFAVIACSADPDYSFNRGDSDFVRSMATVLKAVAIQARAIEVEQKRTTVMSRFSHDLRTPLHGILGSIALLNSSVDSGEREQAGELLTTLDAATREMERLMNDMLDEESSNRLDQSRRAETNARAWGAVQRGHRDGQHGQTGSATSSDSTLSTFDFGQHLPLSPGSQRATTTAALPLPLPLLPIPEPLHQALLSSDPRDAPKEPLSVLIVEDEAISRKLLAMAVKRAVKGVKIAQARDGVEGLTAFCNSHPHLVLTDVNMPIMDGIVSAKAMRTVEAAQGWERSTIYTITGLGQADVQKRRDALNVTLDGWLVKGQHRMEDIQAIVREVDERRKGRGDHDPQVDLTRSVTG